MFFFHTISCNNESNFKKIEIKNAPARKLKPIDCNKVKTGNFEYFDKNTGITAITRTDSSQLEVNKELNYKATFDVVWKDSCTYELRNKKVANKLVDKKEYLIVSILSIRKEDYTVLIQSNKRGKLMELDLDILP